MSEVENALIKNSTL